MLWVSAVHLRRAKGTTTQPQAANHHSRSGSGEHRAHVEKHRDSTEGSVQVAVLTQLASIGAIPVGGAQVT